MDSLNGKATGGTLTASEWNQLPTEVQNIITQHGIALSGGDLNQLGKAIAGYVANGRYYTDGGAANAYVLTQIGSKQALPSYTNGSEFVFKPANANTGASTVNVAGLGVKNIKDLSGNDPQAGAIPAGVDVTLRYNLASDICVIVDTTTIRSATVIESQSANVTPLLYDNSGREMGQPLKAWANWDGTGVVNLRDNFNVSSITDNGTGNYSANFANALANSNYSISTNSRWAGGPYFVSVPQATSLTTTKVDINTGTTGGAATDIDIICINIAAND